MWETWRANPQGAGSPLATTVPSNRPKRARLLTVQRLPVFCWRHEQTGIWFPSTAFPPRFARQGSKSRRSSTASSSSLAAACLRRAWGGLAADRFLGSPRLKPNREYDGGRASARACGSWVARRIRSVDQLWTHPTRPAMFPAAGVVGG